MLPPPTTTTTPSLAPSSQSTGKHNTISLDKHLLHCQDGQSFLWCSIYSSHSSTYVNAMKSRVITFALQLTPLSWKGSTVGGIHGRQNGEVGQIVDDNFNINNNIIINSRSYINHKHSNSNSNSMADAGQTTLVRQCLRLKTRTPHLPGIT